MSDVYYRHTTLCITASVPLFGKQRIVHHQFLYQVSRRPLCVSVTLLRGVCGMRSQAEEPAFMEDWAHGRAAGEREINMLQSD